MIVNDKDIDHTCTNLEIKNNKYFEIQISTDYWKEEIRNSEWIN